MPRESIKVQSLKQQKPSRLELYVEILNSLEKMRNANLLSIQDETNIEPILLERAMTFLENQGLVQKTKIGNGVFYENTLRGDRITAYFRQNITQTSSEKLNYA